MATTLLAAPISTSAAQTSSAIPKGEFFVLEDNGRTPSGVSYVVENRHLMQRAFPDLMQDFAIESVSEYGTQLWRQADRGCPARRF